MNECNWISVEDRFPEYNQRVLIYQFSSNEDVRIQIFRWWQGDEPNIKFWMPLPEPPKESS